MRSPHQKSFKEQLRNIYAYRLSDLYPKHSTYEQITHNTIFRFCTPCDELMIKRDICRESCTDGVYWYEHTFRNDGKYPIFIHLEFLFRPTHHNIYVIPGSNGPKLCMLERLCTSVKTANTQTSATIMIYCTLISINEHFLIIHASSTKYEHNWKLYHPGP